jgi:hypothetical protein
VEEHISMLFPAQFALLFDGWTCENSSTYYLVVLASFQTLNGQTQKVLLGFTVFSDESSYTASDHKAIIKEVLGTFGKSWKNGICLVGDNCPTNKVGTLKHFINIQALADKCGLPLVGCAAH